MTSQIAVNNAVPMLKKSIATGATATFKFGAYFRGLLFSASQAAANAGYFSAVASSNAAAVYVYNKISATGLSVTTSGDTVTITNNGSAQALMLLVVLSGDMPTVT